MSKPAGVFIDEARHKAQELQSQRRHSQEFLNNARSRPSSLVLRGAFGGGVSEPAGTPARSRVAAPEQDDALAMVLERLLSLEARAPHQMHMYMHTVHSHAHAPVPRTLPRVASVRWPSGCSSQGRIDRRFSAIETKLGIETSIDTNAPAPVAQAKHPAGKAKGGVVFVVPPDG